MARAFVLPRFLRGLSARLLVLTMIFVMVSEVLIFVPSVARFRFNYLQGKIADAELAILALEATPDNMVSEPLARELLTDAGAYGIVLHKPSRTLMLDAGGAPRIDATYNLGDDGSLRLITDALMALSQQQNRILRVLGLSPRDPHVVVEVIIDEAPMVAAMRSYARHILELSVMISLLTAALLYLALHWLLLTPLRRLTASMVAFRDNPEDESRAFPPSRRADEIGLAQRELHAMQDTVRQALRLNARLAALGTAVTKINHDLRNILTTVRLMSDSLADSEAPEVKRVTPRLLAAIDRAVALCTRTLSYTREGAPPLRRTRFALAGLVAEIAELVQGKGEDAPLVVNNVAAKQTVEADREQLFRVVLNLVRNAIEAGARRVTVAARPDVEAINIEIADDGPGLPPKARDNLFRPFAGSARLGGTGLGLAIAREIMRAHGGDIALCDSSAAGTAFCLRLPDLGAADRRAADETARSPADA
ncbi:MAG TPA: HAMP domain-containing sensor histidine kinase [Stellaceae bacterium]|nr:HAMP domain-containing sensor histidine kinase [Stellaceae bacterium]